MKGFIYLLEIAVSAILITNIFNGNLTEIEKVKPVNIGYRLKIIGSPKSDIKVGCVSYCEYIDSLLTDTYVNGHWVKFTVEPFDINAGIPDDYDAVVFVNYTGYSISSVKSNISNYLSKGGIVIGINATISNTNTDFNNIFGLTSTSSASGNHNFTTYNPSNETIPKHFLGFGFDITYPNPWYIWEEPWTVTHLSPTTINISRGSVFRVVIESSTFNLTSYLDGKIYWFKLRKIWYQNKVDIQPLNVSFVFKDFGEVNDVTGKINVVSLPTGQAVMTTNNSAIWISDFPLSDEYRTLVKAAIASRKDEWFAKVPTTTKETLDISSFVSLCCDMPETPELILTLWYKV